LYSLYCILKKSGVLAECKFETPVIKDDVLTVSIHLSKEAQEKCSRYLKASGFVAEHLKQDRFKVKLDHSVSKLNISFIRLGSV
jgi:hypothetical protein